jgi:hypothetical protein
LEVNATGVVAEMWQQLQRGLWGLIPKVFLGS